MYNNCKNGIANVSIRKVLVHLLKTILNKLYSSLFFFCFKILLFKLEVSGQDIIHQVVKVGSIDESLSLVAWVHGSPAKLFIGHLSLHEAPHRTTHHWDRLFVWHDQELTNFINLNSLAEELTCKIYECSTYCSLMFHEYGNTLTNKPV